MARLDIGRAYTFGFEDGDWIVKLLLGGLILLFGLVFSIVLVGLVAFLILSGYVVAIARNVAQGRDVPLPRWENMGEMLVDGLRVTVATVVWSLPVLFLLLPLFVLTLLVPADSDVWGAVLAILFICLGLPAILYGVFVALISPVLMWQIAAERRVAAALNVGRVWQIFTAHLGKVILIAIVLWVTNLLATLVGLLICGVGILLTSVWYLWVEGHLVGQLGRLVQEDGGAEVVAPV